MVPWQELLRRCLHLHRSSRFEDELRDEMQMHIDMRAHDLEHAGMARPDALAQARREFGSPTRAADETRRVWRFQWLEDLGADLRYALRAYRRQPGFALTVCASLALGIGANSAVFTAVDAVLLKRLAVSDPDSLVRVSVMRASGDQLEYVPREFVQFLRHAPLFADVVTHSGDGLSFTYDGRAERIMGEAVSPNFFAALGVTPVLGQGFSADVRAGRWAAEAVLSYRFWQRRFAGDVGVIGRTIRLNEYPFVVVGVSPPSFLDLVKGFDPELRIPVLPDGREVAQIGLVSGSSVYPAAATARLEPNVTRAQAEAMLNGLLPQFLRATSNPRINRDRWTRILVSPGARGWPGQLDQLHVPLFVLLALAAIALLIACANVAGMLLARASARRRELAVRVSIGAGRGRLVRQLIAESLLLAIMAGALAVPFAYGTARILPRFMPQGHISLAIDLHPDVRVLVFTGVLAALTGLLIGLMPALQTTRGDLTGALKADSAAAVGDARGATLRRTLVAGQVAFSLVILIMAGLFARALSDLRPSDFGSRPDRVLLFTMKPQSELYRPDQVRTIANALVRGVASVPGVRAVALAETGPLASRRSTVRVRVAGQEAIVASGDDVTPGFFDAIGVRLVAGRDFRAGDSPTAPRVAIINETLAHRLFNGDHPIGRVVELPAGAEWRPYEIVGVAADFRYHDLHVAPAPSIWCTFQGGPPSMPTLHVRTTDANTGPMIGAVMREFDAIDTGFPVFNIGSLEMRIESALARERMVSVLATAFGVLALLLTAVGLYSVLAYSVARRTREIGLRMALGSSLPSVCWLVAREAAQIVLMGLVAGSVLALVAGRLIAQLFLGVPAGDAVAFGASAAVLLLIAAVAVAIPALRAAGVDPLTALRTD